MVSVEEVIVRWLIDEGFEVKSIDPRFPIKTEWGIDVKTPPPMNVGFRIFRPKVKPDRMLLMLGVAISPEHLKSIESLKLEERFKFSSKLMLELIKVCNICNIVIEPTPLNPKGITVTMMLLNEYIRELSKQEFLDKVYTLLNTYIAIVSYFNQYFPVIPKSMQKSDRSLRIM